MNVLVTGGSGFVGRHLINLLLQHGYKVVATTTQKDFSLLPKDINLSWVICDIRDELTVQSLLKVNDFDHIYHLAAIAVSTDNSYKGYNITNVLGTNNLLSSVELFSVDTKVLIVSTSHVYGEISVEDNPIDESTILNPNNFYAASKASMEMVTRVFINKGLRINIVRPFNHTGLGQSDKFVCSSIAKQVAEIKKNKLDNVLNMGNVSVRRDFTDVEDVVMAYLLLMESNIIGQEFNICSGTTISIKEIIETIGELAGLNLRIEVNPILLRTNDLPIIVGDNNKFKAMTGWEPNIPFKKTLEKLYNDWYEKV